MISARIAIKGIERQIGEAVERVNRRLQNAMNEGLEGAILATPEDTGFLRASWHIRVDGEEPPFRVRPSAALKADYDRNRALPRPVASFVEAYEDAPGTAFSLDFIRITGQIEKARRQKRALPTALAPATIQIVNDARYAELVDTKGVHAGFSEVARGYVISAISRALRGRG